jgi:hypothetical protein
MKRIILTILFLIIKLSIITVAGYEVESNSFPFTNQFSPSKSWESSNAVALVDFAFSHSIAPVLSAQNTEVNDADVKAELKTDPLFYPNPFRLADGAQLGYQLSKDMDVEIRIYDLFSREIFRDYYPAGTNGGFGGDSTYNKIQFNKSSFGEDLSAGIYFFVIINEGNVLGKGKFAVRP